MKYLTQTGFDMKHIIYPLLCFLLCGCVTPITLHKKTHRDLSSRPTKKIEKIIPSFLFGLVSSDKKIKVYKECQTTWQTIKVTRSFLHIISAGLTMGIYTPFKVIITCSIKKKSNQDDFELFNTQEEGYIK